MLIALSVFGYPNAGDNPSDPDRVARMCPFRRGHGKGVLRKPKERRLGECGRANPTIELRGI